MKTVQLERWKGEFGNAYIERNEVVSENIAKRVQVWTKILNEIQQDSPQEILEVGCNIGLNLRALQKISSAKLFGLEPNQKARQRLLEDHILPSANIKEGSAFDLPFADQSIDLVFTCGVLIHIAPNDLECAYQEIYRVAKKYILSIELFAKKPEAIHYRGHEDMLFKRDFGLKWLELYPDLKPIAQGFCWQPVTSIDDSTWWLFKKD